MAQDEREEKELSKLNKPRRGRGGKGGRIVDELARTFGLTLYEDPSGLNKKHEHIERTQTMGAETWAFLVDASPAKDREAIRQDAKSIIAWLETFLIRSEPPASFDERAEK